MLAQDEEDGGISDRPEDMADVYHTYFGIAGLSLMGYSGLRDIDPTWALPSDVVQRIKARNAAAAGAASGAAVSVGQGPGAAGRDEQGKGE